MKKETNQLLLRASNEIKTLRRQNEIMSVRLDMFDKCMLMFNTAPAYPGFGMTEDVALAIDKHIDDENKNNVLDQNSKESRNLRDLIGD